MRKLAPRKHVPPVHPHARRRTARHDVIGTRRYFVGFGCKTEVQRLRIVIALVRGVLVEHKTLLGRVSDLSFGLFLLLCLATLGKKKHMRNVFDQGV